MTQARGISRLDVPRGEFFLQDGFKSQNHLITHVSTILVFLSHFNAGQYKSHEKKYPLLRRELPSTTSFPARVITNDGDISTNAQTPSPRQMATRRCRSHSEMGASLARRRSSFPSSRTSKSNRVRSSLIRGLPHHIQRNTRQVQRPPWSSSLSDVEKIPGLHPFVAAFQLHPHHGAQIQRARNGRCAD